MNTQCKIDNARYTVQIDEAELDKYSDQDYESYAKKMDLVLLHAVSEQRCRPFGCRLQNCLSKFHDLNKCSVLFRQLNECVDKERKKVIYQFIQTNKQPMS